MSHFITLIKTEYLKRKHAYWMPVWIIAGIAAIVLIVSVTAAIVHWEEIQIGFLNMAFDYEDIQDGVKVGAFGTLAFMAFIFFIFMLINVQSSLSKEKELGCELFYRCQPVNIWTCTASRYLMHVFAGAVLLLGLGILVALVTSVVSAFTVGGFYPGSALMGALLGVIIYLKLCLVFGSLYFFFSSVFRNNAFIKGTAVLGIIELLFYLIEELLRNTVSLPNIFSGLIGLAGNFNVDSGLTLADVLGDYRLIIAFLFAGACYAGGTLIYKYKTSEA